MRLESFVRWVSTLATLVVVVAIFLLTLQSVKDTVALSTSASDAIVSTAESASHALVDDEASFLKFNPGAVVIQPLRLEIRYRQLAYAGEYLVLGFAAASTAMLWLRRFERALKAGASGEHDWSELKKMLRKMIESSPELVVNVETA